MYQEAWKHKNIRKMIVANAINRFGDSIDAIAFTWLTYALTNNASLSAVVLAANAVPMLFQPVLAPIVDAMKKQRVMVIADVLRAALLLLFIGLYATHQLQGWMFVAFTFGMNMVESFRIPASISFYPQLSNGQVLEAA